MINSLRHIDFFRDLLQQPENELVKKAVEEGRIPIGYSCCIVPEPLLSMGKAFPIKLKAQHIESTENSTYYLSSMVCEYARSILEAVLDNDFHFLKGNVGTSSCIHITRAAEYFEILDTHKHEKNFFNSMVDIPRKKGFEPWLQVLVKQYREKVAKELENKYGIDASDDSLRKAIKFHNEFTKIIKEISDFRKLDHPKITGSEFHTIYTATKIAPKDMLMEKLQETLEELKERKGITDYRARIMVVGSIMDNPEFTELIEEQGAIVVADRYCMGSLPGLEQIPEEGDPFYSMAKHYIEISQCPRFMGNDIEKRDYALEIVKEYKVDGILFEILKFCEMWGYENLTFIPDMKAANIPIVGIERDYNPSSLGQIKTRVQAFIETIEIKKINFKQKGKT